MIVSTREGLKLFELESGGWREAAASDSFLAGACCFHDDIIIVGCSVPGYPAGCVGTLRSYRVDDITHPISERPVPGGRPSAGAVAPDGRSVLTASFFGGCVSVFPLDVDGRLSAPRQVLHQTGRSVQVPRQQAAHPHDVCFAPDGSSVLIPDLGTDSTWIYSWRGNELQPAQPAQAPAWPETGPRHACWRPDARIAWVLGELNGLIHILAHDPASSWTTSIGHASCLPPDYSGPVGAATLCLHPSGRWLYASLRATGSIARFAVGDDGQLHDPRHSFEKAMPVAMSCHPDGEQLVVAHSSENRVCSWSLGTDGCLLGLRYQYALPGPAAMARVATQGEESG